MQGSVVRPIATSYLFYPINLGYAFQAQFLRCSLYEVLKLGY